MITTIKQQLDALVGQTKIYKGKKVTITKYKDVGGTNIVIFIDGRPKNLLMSEIDNFLLDLHDLDSDPAKHPTAPTVSFPKNDIITYQPTAESSEVKQTLMETLKKVKEDASFIPQAQAVCEVVNQIVNVQKTEIQMLNILNKKK